MRVEASEVGTMSALGLGSATRWSSSSSPRLLAPWPHLPPRLSSAVRVPLCIDSRVVGSKTSTGIARYQVGQKRVSREASRKDRTNRRRTFLDVVPFLEVATTCDCDLESCRKLGRREVDRSRRSSLGDEQPASRQLPRHQRPIHTINPVNAEPSHTTLYQRAPAPAPPPVSLSTLASFSKQLSSLSPPAHPNYTPWSYSQSALALFLLSFFPSTLPRLFSSFWLLSIPFSFCAFFRFREVADAVRFTFTLTACSGAT